MRWFRDNIRHGSWLAFFALVINLGLSFGHFHATDGKRPGGGLTSLTVVVSSDIGRTQDHPDDAGADYLCPICTAVSAMAHALASVPPELPVEFTATGLDRPIKTRLAFIEQPNAAFQSRAPPIS
jgi:hypothetical protein